MPELHLFRGHLRAKLVGPNACRHALASLARVFLLPVALLHRSHCRSRPPCNFLAALHWHVCYSFSADASSIAHVFFAAANITACQVQQHELRELDGLPGHCGLRGPGGGRELGRPGSIPSSEGGLTALVRQRCRTEGRESRSGPERPREAQVAIEGTLQACCQLDAPEAQKAQGLGLFYYRLTSEGSSLQAWSTGVCVVLLGLTLASP